jgi:hypothetical protein
VEVTAMDLVFVGLGVLFFAASAAVAVGFERLRRRP